MTVQQCSAIVLLVDDEPNITDALKRALRREPYEILTAQSAAEAQQRLEHHHVDVVISDEQMPGVSGSEFLAAVRQQYPHTIRMILSGQASLEAAVRAINEGEVYRFFLKPCNPTDLVFTMRQALTHKRLEQQSRKLLREFQLQASRLSRLERQSPAIMHLETDDQGAVVLDESDGDCEIGDLLAQIEDAISRR
ncbi:MAG TPA: response regulator [Steroidobacteraceae bacterium]|nr:response regulator [Steroidobacteraceae bacterium]